MKTKTFNKKLSLSKQTISNLGNTEMNFINGGGSFMHCVLLTMMCIRMTDLILASEECMTNKPSVRRSYCGC